MSQSVDEVLSGIFKITLPVPISSLRSVFVYLVIDNEENLLIDTGWSGRESWEAMKLAFSNIGFNPKDLQRVIISHLHPDHFGLSSILKKEAPNSKLMMHEFDAERIIGSKEEFENFLLELRYFIASNSASETDLEEIMKATTPFVKYLDQSTPDVRLKGGEKLKAGKFDFEVIWTPGHTRGNICLYDPESRILFSGDHVLPTITPNVSLTPTYAGNPLGDYLSSIETIAKLNPVSKVLPSHEFVFENLGKRLVEIRIHHEERLKDALNVLNTTKHISGYEVASKLHWYTGSWEKLSAWEKRAALMETLAHLEYLTRQNKVRKIIEHKKIYFLLAE